MEYKGNLYGKVGQNYFPLEATTDDFERLEKQSADQKDVAVKFAEWKDKHYLLWSHLYVIKSDYQHTGWPETIELPDLFEYFIKSIYGK